MRLSTAIMLGSATCKLIPRNINSCAYGCALNAMGIPAANDLIPSIGASIGEWITFNQTTMGRYKAVHRLWPWTEPINFDTALVSDKASDVWRMFDNQVCEGEITLEELADYVRSIEPDCDCNRFNCTCTKQTSEVSVQQEVAVR